MGTRRRGASGSRGSRCISRSRRTVTSMSGEGHANDRPRTTPTSPPTNKKRRRARDPPGQERQVHQPVVRQPRGPRDTSAWSTASRSTPTRQRLYWISLNISSRRLRRARGSLLSHTASDAKPHLCVSMSIPRKQLWLATGQDGQIFKIDWQGQSARRDRQPTKGSSSSPATWRWTRRATCTPADTSVGRIAQGGAVEQHGGRQSTA